MISIIACNCIVRKVLVDQGSLADILFFTTLKKMQLSEYAPHPFYGDLIGFSREKVNVKGYMWLRTIFGTEPMSKTIDI